MINRGEERSANTAAESRYTIEGQLTASGLGSVGDAYKRLLFNLCKSGCTLPKIQVIPGLLTTVILYTIEGTRGELAVFREAVNG